MLENKVHSVDDRIVSLSQLWVRPIVMGKSKTPTEFGAKISISVVNEYTFIDKISFDAYNEGDHNKFEAVVERYHERFGYYPERILADKIYRSRKNRGLCRKTRYQAFGTNTGKTRQKPYGKNQAGVKRDWGKKCRREEIRQWEKKTWSRSYHG